MRLLDPSHPRPLRRVARVEVVACVVGGQAVRLADQALDGRAHTAHGVGIEHAWNHQESVVLVGVQLGLVQHRTTPSGRIRYR